MSRKSLFPEDPQVFRGARSDYVGQRQQSGGPQSVQRWRELKSGQLQSKRGGNVTIRTCTSIRFLPDSLPYTCRNPITHLDSESMTHNLLIIPYDIIIDVTMMHADSYLLITYVIMTHTD